MLERISPPRNTRSPEEHRSKKRTLVRLGALGLGAALAAAPLATVHALKETAVHDTTGVVPVTLTLAPGDTSLDLGVVGSLSLPATSHGIGIHASVDGPPIGTDSTTVGDIISPKNLQAYTQLYQHPEEAIDGYKQEMARSFRHELLINELELAGSIGALMLLLSSVSFTGASKRQQKYWTLSLISATTLVPSLLAAHDFHDWQHDGADHAAVYALPSLDGTALDGATADNPLLASAIERSAPKIKQLTARQETMNAAFLARATASLEQQQDHLVGPRETEQAFLLGSDLHSNTIMSTLTTRLVTLINETFGEGTVSFVGLAGDQTYGSVAEKSQVAMEAKISDGAPMVAALGNHDSPETRDQLHDVDIATLEGKPLEIADTRILGDIDPNITQFLGATSLRDDDMTVDDFNQHLYDLSEASHPELLLTHEAYNLEPFIGRPVTQATIDAWFSERTSDTTYSIDTTPDIPANLIAYGHWHREGIAPKVVWNSDGSWSVIAELNTAGGAIASPTLTHFSTPWSTPGQTASVTLFYKNTESGLITGYQQYDVTTEGDYLIHERVDIGSPDGQPFALDNVEADGTAPLAHQRGDAAATNPKSDR